MVHLRVTMISVAILCLTSFAAAAEKSCDELFANIQSSYVESVNSHLEVRTVAWLEFGARVGNGVAAAYPVEFPGLDMKYPVTTVVCAQLESARYDSPGLSFDLKVHIDDLVTSGFTRTEGAPNDQTYLRCLNIDECTITVK